MGVSRGVLLVALFGSGLTQKLVGSDLKKAPPSFMTGGKKAVYADFSNVELHVTFDVSTAKAVGLAVIDLTVDESGMPIFDLVPGVQSVRFDGTVLALSQVKSIRDPDGQSMVRAVDVVAEAGVQHSLEMTYDLSNRVTFQSGRVAAGFFMNDLDDRQFWELYGPTNLEYDQFRQVVHVSVIGTTQPHEVFTNGETQSLGTNRWRVEYPEYFTASSPYFHLVAAGRFKVQRSTFNGVNGPVPLTVYGNLGSSVNLGMTRLKNYMAELESTYGAFAHQSFTAYLTEDGQGGGGMEYCGATITSMWALSHETAHSWFARGVMPANGNSGWIDEAIASWRDDGYPRRSSPGAPRVLAGFSPYKRFTTSDAYTYGADLMGVFDGWISGIQANGLRGVLRDLFSVHQRQTITVPVFQGALEDSLGRSLQDFFDTYVYGRGSKSVSDITTVDGPQVSLTGSRHPRPFTQEELVRLR